MEADEDARVSQVIGLETDGRRVFVLAAALLLGLVGGETRPWACGMGREMEELVRWWARAVFIVQGCGERGRGSGGREEEERKKAG